MIVVSVDFDGVIHKYSEGWKTGEIYDEPVEGAIQWLLEMDKEVHVIIHSSRLPKQADSMRRWLDYYIRKETKGREIPSWESEEEPWYVRGDDEWSLIDCLADTGISFSDGEKPRAHISIDDRAFTFQGTFPSYKEIAEFKPWNRK
jgi:hypothetical protein